MRYVTAVNRRAFLGLTGAVLAGCAAGPTASSGGTPRRGGRLRAAFAGGGATEVFDPHLTNLYVEIARAKAVYDKLAEFGSDMSPRPRLAAGWEPSADLRTWRITLREATFHDGRPLGARDVLASYARIVAPDSTRRAKASLSVIDLANSREVDDRTVEFRLTRPYGEFPNALATLGAYVIPAGTTAFDRPVGTGPFRFAAFEPGRTFLATRHDEHWDGAPHLDELEIVVTSDESARVNALLGGQVEYAHDLTPATARTYDRGGRLQLHRLPLSNFHGLVMKVDRPPFDRVELRQALFHLVDREELVRSVLQGAGEVCNDLYGKGYRHYADDLPQRRPDPDRARSLVRRAGAEGLTIDLDTSDASPGLTEAALAISDQARRVGLNLTVRTGDKDTYWSDISENGVLASYRSGGMPLDSHISQRLLTSSTTNVSRWRRPEFDALYERAQATPDEGTRAEHYRRMQELLFEEGGFLWWGVSEWIVASAPNVRGVDERAPTNTQDWARFDKVWLA